MGGGIRAAGRTVLIDPGGGLQDGPVARCREVDRFGSVGRIKRTDSAEEMVWDDETGWLEDMGRWITSWHGMAW